MENINDIFKKIKTGEIMVREKPPKTVKLWDNWINDKLIDYISTDDYIIKSLIFNELYPRFSKIIQVILNKYNIFDSYIYYDDYIQDMIIFLNAKVLPKITKDRIITAHQYIYISLLNYTKLLILNNNKYNKIKGDEIKDTIDWIVSDVCVTDIQIQIIKKIDDLIDKQSIMNKKYTLYLFLLKDYLIKNHFDGTGFKDYVCKELNISETYYRYISSIFKIKTKELNRKVIK
jgi:hypothetical protein